MAQAVSRAALVVAGLLAGTLAWPGVTGGPGDTARQAALFATAWVASQVLLYRSSSFGVLDVGVLYLLVFGLFHGGLLLDAVVAGPAGSPGWLTNEHAPAAVRLATIAMLTFALVYYVCGRYRSAGPVRLEDSVRLEDQAPPAGAPRGRDSDRPAVGAVGVVVLMCGLALFVAALFTGSGFDALQQGYVEFVSEFGGSVGLSYAMLFIGIGEVLCVAGGGRYRTIGWLGFGAFAAVAFPLGTRGAVLFPLVAMAALEARRGARLRLATGLAAMVVLFWLISLVRTTRSVGVSGLFTGLGSASPWDAIVEMGHSLLPTVVVLDWHDHGESYRWGLTLVAVPVRAVERWTGWHGGPPLVDGRLFNQEILMRAGPIGGSPVAEGYHNLGLVGVVALIALIALALSLLSSRGQGALADAVLGVTMIPLVTGIRNSSAPTLTQIAIGLAFVGAGAVLSRLRPQAAHPQAPERASAPVGGPRDGPEAEAA